MSEAAYHGFENDTFEFWDTLIVPIDNFEIQYYPIKCIMSLIEHLSQLSRKECESGPLLNSIASNHNFRFISGTYLTQSGIRDIDAVHVRDKLIESWIKALEFYDANNNFPEFVEYTTSFLSSELHRFLFFVSNKELIYFATRIDSLPPIVEYYLRWRVKNRNKCYD